MGKVFFDIRSPRDMLEKAKRELERLKTQVSTDNIFNFFVTVYHVVDYVESQNLVPQAVLDTFRSDPDFQMCRFICHKGKHLVLKTMPDKDTQAIITRGSVWGEAVWGEVVWGGSGTVIFTVDGKEINPIVLGEGAIKRWEDFFTANGI